MRRIIVVMTVVALLLAAFVAPAAAQYGQTIHVVQPGETLASIARWYGTTVQAIASANGIWNPNVVWAGQRLVIPAGTGYPPPQGNSYIVRPGDTLAGIARYFGTTVWAIGQANNIFNLNWIYAGMRLVIPTGNGYPPPPQQNYTSYWVKPGDTLARIAAAYGTTWQALASYNGISNPNRIFWGMLIKIPVYHY